jgi:hypothetical protein
MRGAALDCAAVLVVAGCGSDETARRTVGSAEVLLKIRA